MSSSLEYLADIARDEPDTLCAACDENPCVCGDALASGWSDAPTDTGPRFLASVPGFDLAITSDEGGWTWEVIGDATTTDWAPTIEEAARIAVQVAIDEIARTKAALESLR